MEQVQDDTTLSLLRTGVSRSQLAVLDVGMVPRLEKAYYTSYRGVYQVYISLGYIALRGIINITDIDLTLFLDVNSMLALMNMIVEASLTSYNAGHDPRFKGV